MKKYDGDYCVVSLRNPFDYGFGLEVTKEKPLFLFFDNIPMKQHHIRPNKWYNPSMFEKVNT